MSSSIFFKFWPQGNVTPHHRVCVSDGSLRHHCERPVGGGARDGQGQGEAGVHQASVKVDQGIVLMKDDSSYKL